MQSKEVEEKIQKMQQEFQAKAQELMMSGRSDEIQKLTLEFQKNVEALVKNIEQNIASQIASNSPVNGFNSHMTGLNLERLAHTADKDFYRHFAEKTNLLQFVEQINHSGIREQNRRYLLSRAMRLTENISKPLFEVINKCKETLNFKAPIDFFVAQDSFFNAWVSMTNDGSVNVFFSSSLLENFELDELAFVIGHELGHAIFGHTNIPIEPLIRQHYYDFSAKDIIRLRSWQRAAELSADRTGLLCAQSFDAACRGFFKLSSGITSHNYKFNVADYMNQYSDLTQFIKTSSSENMDELYSSHPLNPIRLRALDIFQQSEVYQEISGQKTNPAKYNDEQMNAEIKSFMQLMEPSYLDDNSDVSASIREFLFLAGYIVANSDGNLDPKEAKQLVELLNSSDGESRLSTMASLTKQNIIDQILAHAKKIHFELPPAQCMNVIRDLFLVASADGTVTDTELFEMSNACNVLGIHPGFLNELLSSLPPVQEKQAA